MQPRCSALVLIAALTTGAAAHADQILSLYPIQSQGLEEEELVELDKLLRRQAGKLSGVIVHSRKKTSRVIERASGEAGDCGGKLHCLVEVGELSGASHLAYGSAVREGASYRLDLKLIDVDKEKIVRRAEASLAGSAREVASAASGLMAKLLMPQQFNGTLIVRMLVPGARVLLDDIEVGVTPMEPLTGLKPRFYTLSVVLEGAQPLRKSIQIGQDSTTTVKVDLHDERLVADVEHEGALDQGPPPKVARLLAQRLKSSAASPAPSTTSTLTTLAATGPGASEGDRGGDADRRPSADPGGASPLLIGGISLAGVGGLLGLLGGGGLLAYGLALSNAQQYVDANGVVSDPEAYDAAMEEEPLYLGLGTAGLVGVAFGVAAIGAGVGLLVWSGPEEAGGEEEAAP